MFRKMILTALLAAGTVTGLALTPATAEARPPRSNHGRHETHYRQGAHYRQGTLYRPGYSRSSFEVFYLDCGQWKCSGTYRERCDADRAAVQLRHRGFKVRIDGC